jgi:DNA-binding MarR family transcriptional regulator
MSKDIELLSEIRDLLQVMAEPMLAQRDAKFRAEVRRIAGKSEKNRKAVCLMDGTRTQANIAKELGMDQGNLSRLVKALGAAKLISADEKHPKLLVRVPPTFFDEDKADD